MVEKIESDPLAEVLLVLEPAPPPPTVIGKDAAVTVIPVGLPLTAVAAPMIFTKPSYLLRFAVPEVVSPCQSATSIAFCTLATFIYLSMVI